MLKTAVGVIFAVICVFTPMALSSKVFATVNSSNTDHTETEPFIQQTQRNQFRPEYFTYLGNNTTRGDVFLNQTEGTVSNQTVLAINGINTTSANGTVAGTLANVSQQLQTSLQSPFTFSPTFQPQQQLQPSTLQQQQASQPPLNIIPPPSSQQQASPLTQSSPQPSTTIPPPSTPLYPVPSFPPAGPINYQPPVILSQYSYYDNIGSLHIVGEVLNQAPVTARSVKVIATFYNSNNQVIGTDSGYADPAQLGPGQRAPFEIISLGGSVPMYQMSNYALRVDSQP